jgi:hypothetical protein
MGRYAIISPRLASQAIIMPTRTPIRRRIIMEEPNIDFPLIICV